MTIACGLCGKTVSPERAGKHSLTCKVQVAARVAEDRKARPAQYAPIVEAQQHRRDQRDMVAQPLPPAPDLTGPVAPDQNQPDPEGEALQDAAREYEDEHPGAVTQGMLFGEDWTR